LINTGAYDFKIVNNFNDFLDYGYCLIAKKSWKMFNYLVCDGICNFRTISS